MNFPFFQDSLDRIQNTQTLKDLETLRQLIFAKKGELSTHMRTLSSLNDEDRKTQGAVLNTIKHDLTLAFEQHKTNLEQIAEQQQLTQEKLDITLPGRTLFAGKMHPISETIHEIYTIFKDLGFSLATGNDIEDDFHNFTALNIPDHHPARQEHDTFYFPQRPEGPTYLLRTHTSPVQIRTLKTAKPPVRILAPGRVYRCDSDATHTPMFHQVEGLCIEDTIHMGHLKGCLVEFCERFFGIKNLPLRFRPGYFPFTEPSAEVDIGCRRTADGVDIGAGQDWLEVLGCGMVHPLVLQNAGIDPNYNQGFAFGMGVERLAMIKHGIPDLRMFYCQDYRWIQQYGFAPYY